MVLNRKLKLGFLCQGVTLPLWQALCLEELRKIPEIEIVILFADGDRRRSSTGSAIKGRRREELGKFITAKDHLWRIYERLFIRKNVGPFQLTDTSALIQGLRHLHLTPLRKGLDDFWFEGDDLKTLENEDFDILLNLSLNYLRPEILSLPHYGVWAFHHGDETRYRGQPRIFWEVLNGEPLCGLSLQKCTNEPDAGIVLEKGFVPTSLRSYQQSLEQIYSVGFDWPAKCVRKILNHQWQIPTKKMPSNLGPIRKNPNDLQFIWASFVFAKRQTIYAILTSWLSEKWQIGIIEAKAADLIKTDLSVFSPTWLSTPSQNHFEADPFGYVHQGKLKLLFELFDYHTNRGEIHEVEFDPKTKTYSDLKERVRRQYHLAYPFIFEFENETYALIESFTETKLEYWRKDGQGAWVFDRFVPIQVPLNDPTLYFHEGLWYMFSTRGKYGSNFNLFLSYAKTPFGPFQDHPQNPIKIDVRSCRGAGPLFNVEGKIIRPSQNSTASYGESITLNVITKLSPTEFDEEFLKKLEPPKSWGAWDGFHTIGPLGNEYLVFDVKRITWVPEHVRRLLKRRWGQVTRIFSRS